MKHLISSEKMSEIDLSAQRDYGIPGVVLMENAGLKGWQYLEESAVNRESGGPFVFAAGPGNNGGDCLVMARHAFERYPSRVNVVLAGTELHETPQLQLDILKKMGVPVYIWPDNAKVIEELLMHSSLIVDGLFGTGLKGSLRERSALLVEAMNASGAFKAAVDVPSGLNDHYKEGNPAFCADLTLVFGLPRYAHFLPSARLKCGVLKIINPGFPMAVLSPENERGSVYSFKDFKLPVLGKNAYKSTRGHAAVFAGSPGYSGAAVLSSKAAAGARTGLVTLHAEEDIYQSTASSLFSVMVRPFDTLPSGNYLEKFTAFLAGPGWGNGGREELLEALLQSPLPGVVDADGLRALGSLDRKNGNAGALNRGKKRVLTPHPGELSVLLGIERDLILEDPFKYAAAAAVRYGAVAVLKMHVVYIAGPDGSLGVVDGLNPAMGTGGSGDVLSGITAGFLAQGMDSFDAAVNGVLLHQEAGRRCFEDRGWFTSEKLLDYIPRLIKDEGY